MEEAAKRMDAVLERTDACSALSPEQYSKARLSAACSSSTEEDRTKARTTTARTLPTDDRTDPQWSIETLHSVLAALPQTTGKWTSLQLMSMKHAVSGIQQMIATMEKADCAQEGGFNGSRRESRRPSKELDFNDTTSTIVPPSTVASMSPVDADNLSDLLGSEIWDPASESKVASAA
jgi:hypothetical protein